LQARQQDLERQRVQK